MGKIKRFFRDMSLRRSFVVCMLAGILAATLLSLLLLRLYDALLQQLYSKYFDPAFLQSVQEYSGYGPRLPSLAGLTAMDQFINGMIGSLRIITLPVVFIVCSIAASFFFYHSKLQRPCSLLLNGAEKIAADDLSFKIEYDSRDEMGRLCKAYNGMRDALERNNRRMWRLVEERQMLNASFSHDLRTPLTVLRGHADMLCKYVPQGRYSEEKLLDTIGTMSENIRRLENYVCAMNTICRIEDVTVSPRPTDAERFSEMLFSTADILCRENGKTLRFPARLTGVLRIDPEVVMQVFENMLSNAVRFAAGTVAADCFCRDGMLCLTVVDDGAGFRQEDLRLAAAPYYRGRGTDDKTHFGLGLNICRLLCEKHGGSLTLANSRNGGAMVTAEFAQSERAQA